MRTIKFRAWANGKMYSFENKKWMTMSSSGYIAFQDTLEGSFDEDSDNCMSEDFHLMQFTGLTDRNGAEIYEGDIIKNIHNEQTGAVVYDSNKCYFNVADHYPDIIYNGNMINVPGDGWMQDDIEVVGNVYQNPELL